jgi:ADP-ribose pyrophosphatase YjhB (NUDIX family)
VNVTAPQLAVGAIVLDRDRLLLVQRDREPGAGHWSVPGGRVEPGERLRHALAREVREETGIDIVVDDLAGWAERIDRGHHYVILDFFARPTEPGAVPHAGDDARAAAWVPVAALDGVDLVDGLAEFLRAALAGRG